MDTVHVYDFSYKGVFLNGGPRHDQNQQNECPQNEESDQPGHPL